MSIHSNFLNPINRANSFFIRLRSLLLFYKQVHWKGIPIGFLWILGIVLLVVKHLVDPQNILDTQEYFNEAFQLFDLEITTNHINDFDKLHQFHRRTPLYSLLIFMGGKKIYLALTLQVLAAFYLPWGIYQLLKPIEINKHLRTNLKDSKSGQILVENHPNLLKFAPSPSILVLFLISYPLFAYYSVMSVPEVISSALIVILLNHRHEPLKISVILTLLISIKPVFIVLLPLMILFNLKKSKLWVWILPIGFVLFWMYRGNKILGIPTISSITITNPYDYNRKLLLLKSFNSEQVDSIYSQEYIEIKQLKNPSEVANFMSQKVKESIINNPIEYLILHVKGSLITLIDPGRYDAMVFWNWEKSAGFMGVNDGNKKNNRTLKEWIYMFFFLVLNAIKMIFVVMGLVYCKRFLPVDLYWLLVLVMSVYLFTIGPVGSARYLIPVYGILTFFGGWGVVFIAEKFKSYRSGNSNNILKSKLS